MSAVVFQPGHLLPAATILRGLRMKTQCDADGTYIQVPHQAVDEAIAFVEAAACLLQADRAFDMARARKQEVDNRFVRLNAEKKPATEQDYWDRKSADHSYARAADERINVLRRLGATHLEPVPTQAVRS